MTMKVRNVQNSNGRMIKPFRIISLLIPLLLVNLGICPGQEKSPIEVVKLFDKAYGGPLMDEIADYTTPNFRDNKPKSVWVVETWKSLYKLKYERLNSSVIDTKVKGNRAVVVVKEIYYLVKEGERWLIDELWVSLL